MIRGICLSSALMLALAGCDRHDHSDGSTHTHGDEPAAGAVAVAELAPSQAATTQPTMNNVRGTVTFTRAADGVAVSAQVTGLPPNSRHGFHIHEKGDLSGPDLMSTGPHWDPKGTHTHGAPGAAPVHAGDMGNLLTDASGAASLTITIPGITIDDAVTGVVGRSVIVHAVEDDLTSQPAGNAGARVAGGVIRKKD